MLIIECIFRPMNNIPYISSIEVWALHEPFLAREVHLVVINSSWILKKCREELPCNQNFSGCRIFTRYLGSKRRTARRGAKCLSVYNLNIWLYSVNDLAKYGFQFWVYILFQ